MRILVVGDWHSELHEETVYQAFKKLGHEVHRFSWHEYFQPSRALWIVNHVLKKIQNKFMTGPIVARINRDFLATVTALQPNLVFIYRGTHITPASLRAVKARFPSVTLVGYNNDDPFAPGHPLWLWRHFMGAIPVYDLMLAYRHSNVVDFVRAGAKKVQLLRAWFTEERNHPVDLSTDEVERFNCDVVFAGHYESDNRLEFLEEIVRHGFKLRLFGPGYDWDPVIAKSPVLRHLMPVRLVWGEDYNRALCGAKVALCFFSKLNRDTYTRRCFEIPATRTFMLSEYSENLSGLYQEGVEADFFRSKQELIEKLRVYLSDDARRKSVAEAGYQRVRTDGHDVVSRMRQVLEWAAEGGVAEAV